MGDTDGIRIGRDMSKPDVLRALIADDEPLARRRLRSLLSAEPDFVIRAEARDGLEALDAIAAGGIDVVFLDIRMPVLDGFEVLDSLPTADLPHIVFVTAFVEHAVRAFDANAVDYLVKPFENERFARTLQKLRESEAPQVWHERVTAARQAMRRHTTRLAVRHRGAYELVDVSEIVWVETQRNYLRLHLSDRVRLLRCTLSDFEARVDPETFLRVHRSIIVNQAHIRTIQPRNNSTEFFITLDDGATVRSSRSYRSTVTALIRRV